MEQGYLAQIQALIDQQIKENPEEMKRKMKEFEEFERNKLTQIQIEERAKLTQELIEEMNKGLWHTIDISKIQDLVQRGADVEAKNEYDLTPLHFACLRNALKCSELLLKRGADVRAKNKLGGTPFSTAHTEEMKTLLQQYM